MTTIKRAADPAKVQALVRRLTMQIRDESLAEAAQGLAMALGLVIGQIPSDHRDASIGKAFAEVKRIAEGCPEPQEKQKFIL